MSSNTPLAASWLTGSIQGSLLIALSAGLWWFLAFPAVVSAIVFDMVGSQSRRQLGLGILVSILSGIVIGTFFWTGNGITGAGAILIFLPWAAASIYVSTSVFKWEARAMRTFEGGVADD